MKFIGPYNLTKWEEPVSGLIYVKEVDKTKGTVVPLGYLIFETLEDSHELVALPKEGYSLQSVVLDYDVISTVSPVTLTNISGYHEITTNFTEGIDERPLITVNMFNDDLSFGTVTPGTIRVEPGSNQNFSIDCPNEWTTIASIIVDGVYIEYDPAALHVDVPFTNILEDHILEVYFYGLEIPVLRTITLTSNGHVTVTPEGPYEMSLGEEIPLSIVPDEGYQVDLITSVPEDGVTVYLTEPGNNYFMILNVDENVQVTIDDNLVPVLDKTITVIQPEFGEIRIGGAIVTDPISVPVGDDSQIFELEALYGTSGVKILIDGVEVDWASTYQFINVTEDHTISFTTTTVGTLTLSIVGNTLDAGNPTTVYKDSCATSATLLRMKTDYGQPQEYALLKPILTGGEEALLPFITGAALNWTSSGLSQNNDKIDMYTIDNDYDPDTTTYNNPASVVYDRRLAITPWDAAQSIILNQAEWESILDQTNKGICLKTFATGQGAPAPQGIVRTYIGGATFVFTWEKI